MAAGGSVRVPLAIGAALLAVLLAAGPVRANGPDDESTAPAAGPAAAEPVDAEGAAEETGDVAPSVEPANADGKPSAYPAAAPIEAVSRPSGVWGPVAVATDVLVMRPVGFVSLFAGGAAFVVTSPIRAAIGTLDDGIDALGKRAADVFQRPLGAL